MLIAAIQLTRAQEQTFRTVETAPGKLLRLGLVGNVTKECTPGSMPEIKVVTQPSNGTLAIRSGKSKAGSLARCPNLEVPMQGIFYQANPKFTGKDQAAYTVRNADGRTQSFTFTINVSLQAKPQPKPQDNTDL
jgi:Big-like domain-containing protein